MRVSCYIALAACALAASALKISAAQASFRVISNLNGYDQPSDITEWSPGVLSGISGSSTKVAYSLTVQGTMTVLTSFPSGYNIKSILVGGANHRLYSTVELSSNPANVFSVTSSPNSKETYTAQNFVPSLAQALPDGAILGFAATSGEVVSLVTCDLQGKITPIYQFPASTRLGSNPLYASDGNYYGSSNFQNGTIYVWRVTPTGSFSQVYNMPNGTTYGMPLVQSTDGSLYGTIDLGGANGTGVFYKLTLTGQYTTLYTFPKDKNNSYPTWLIEGSDGNFYGATLGNLNAGGHSRIFRMTRSGQYSVVYEMNAPNGDSGICQCDMIQGSDGIIYGTAQAGGPTGSGEVFALDAGLPKPRPRALRFRPESGAAGTKVLIWGANLLAASVQFNGAAAVEASNSGSNYVWATVPSGATSGPITVTTPGGTAVTHSPFTVSPAARTRSNKKK
jgi:hypothetical protein